MMSCLFQHCGEFNRRRNPISTKMRSIISKLLFAFLLPLHALAYPKNSIDLETYDCGSTVKFHISDIDRALTRMNYRYKKTTKQSNELNTLKSMIDSTLRDRMVYKGKYFNSNDIYHTKLRSRVTAIRWKGILANRFDVIGWCSVVDDCKILGITRKNYFTRKEYLCRKIINSPDSDIPSVPPSAPGSSHSLDSDKVDNPPINSKSSSSPRGD
ncbi:unnamed protein product [Blumeria hordei]|uniref:Uncharacterized protein n=1 Tax=Blumeria hordei TaxID=2867405 RepID=A0A383UWD9_BLUHO|nr:unnamed protein product [Blumeria hordei]